MYSNLPGSDIALEEFESLAVNRLRLLKALEHAKSKGRRDDELKSTLKTLMDRHMTADASAERESAMTMAQCDDFGHHILRIAYSRNEELRKWLVTHETLLFKLRFRHTLSPSERERFLATNELPYEPCSNAELDDVRDDLVQLLESTGKKEEAAILRASGGGAGAATTPGSSAAATTTPGSASASRYAAARAYYKVPFEEVPDLVASRAVVLHRGNAYVPSESLVSLVAGRFRARLAKALVMTNRALAAGVWADEAGRVAPIAAGLALRYLGPAIEGEVGANSQQMRVQDLPKAATEHFPLCMLTLFQALRRDAHLRHGGRMQLSLFLKAIGLRMEDALAFWKGEFTRKITAEDFDKRYAYNLRHNYGKEGKRTDYTPYSCQKCLAQTVGAVGEYHGCPYRTLGSAQLKESLVENMKLTPMQAKQVAEKAQQGHYQLACGRALELRRFGGEELEENVMHPNQYFEMSRKSELGVEGGGGGGDGGGAAAAAMEVEVAAQPVTPIAR